MLSHALELLHEIYPAAAANYTVLDCETTGFDLHKDLVLEFGLVVVRGGRVEARYELILDWTRQPEVQADWLQHRLERVRRLFEKSGKATWRIDLGYVKRGLPPQEALSRLLQILQKQRDVGGFFVGHNLLRFDGLRVQQTLEEWLGRRWRFGKHELVDTLALVRADLYPLPKRAGEKFFDYSQRVLSAASQVKSSLDQVCVPRYRLDADGRLSAETHRAVIDAELTRRLLVRLAPVLGQFEDGVANDLRT